MGRKAKYSKEFKLEIVKRYLKGEGISYLANIYNIPNNHGMPILEWTHKYNELGESAFNESSTNKLYSKEFKESVIHEYLEGKDSLEGLANKYNISNESVVRKWVKKYNEGMEIKDYDPKGDVYTMKSRKTTLEERLEIEKLRNELKRKDMVIEVLKKNIEIQERMERDSRLLNKKTNTKR